jgi:hypothetical protein
VTSSVSAPATIRVAESGAGLVSASWVSFTPPNYDGYLLSNSDGGKDIFLQVQDAGGQSAPFNIGGAGSDIELDRQAPGSTGITAPPAGGGLEGGDSETISWNSFTDNPPGGIKPNSIAIAYDTSSGSGGYSDAVVSGQPDSGSYTWNPVPSIDSQTVRLRLTAWDLAGNAGSVTSSGDFSILSTAPSIGGMALTDDDGANSPLPGYTNGQTVDVAFSGVGGFPNQMWLSESSTFATGAWASWSNPTSFTFATAVETTKTVYVRVRDLVGQTVGNAGDLAASITLDTLGPVLFSAAQTPDANQPWVDLEYSEPMNLGVLTAGNFLVTNLSTSATVNVLSVTQQSPVVYRLETDSQVVGDPHSVAVSNVADRAGNPIDATSAISFWTGVPTVVTRFVLD